MLFVKEFLARNGCFGLFSLKMGLGLVFGAYFLYEFSIKMFPI